jgi:hypothetical protein
MRPRLCWASVSASKRHHINVPFDVVTVRCVSLNPGSGVRPDEAGALVAPLASVGVVDVVDVADVDAADVDVAVDV